MRIFLILLLLTACTPTLPKAPTPLDIPQNFPNQNDEGKENLVEKNWKLFFADQQLVSLIDTALKENRELNILNQDISIANNEVLARQGQYLPKVDIGAGYDAERTSKFSHQGATDEAAGLPTHLRTREAAINASWEIDIWKKLRNSAKSAYFEYLATIEGKNFATTQLVAEVADDYFDLMALDNQLEIVEQFIKTLKQAQEMVQLQRKAGRITSLPLKRFDAEVQKNESRKYRLQQQIIVTENHLNTLLGRLPQPIARASKKFKEIKMQEFKTDIPAKLIDNRPDIKQAALKIESAKLNVKSVKAQFYPSLTIDASLGYRSFNTSHFNSPEAIFSDVAGNLTAPLINRNAIKAEYLSANNKQIQAIYSYEQTFIKAFAEVSNQLAAVENLQKIYDAKSQQVADLAESFDISNALFKAARVDYLEALLTRRDYLEAQMELTEVKQQQLSSYVNLYRALGGGWRN